MSFLSSMTIYYIIAGAGFGLMLIITLVLMIFMMNSKPGAKKVKIKVDEEFIKELVLNYGGIENIQEVVVDNNSGRLRTKVSNLDIVNLEALKAISHKGVFVTNNVVVTLFKYDSIIIKKAIEGLK